MSEGGEITRLLREAEEGQAEAAERLYGLVEKDLRQIARRRKREAGARPGEDAATTLLVDEAFCRLVGQGGAGGWQAGDRRRFYGYASVKIHDFLVDELRKQRAEKRGGGRHGGELAEAAAGTADAGEGLDVLIDLREALGRLQEFAPDDAGAFRLRHFLGATFKEIADLLSISETSAKRNYQQAQLWLRRELKGYGGDS